MNGKEGDGDSEALSEEEGVVDGLAESLTLADNDGDKETDLD